MAQPRRLPRHVPELLDRDAPRCLVVLVDAFTSVGSQYVDSRRRPVRTYLCDEIVPLVDERFETNGLRGVAGKSSGGTARR